MRPKLDQHLDYFIVIALAAVCYLMFFHELDGIGFLGPDEPRYAAVARGMYETGDYITPRLHGETWFEKPPLLYWFAALGFALFGVGETGARFPSAMCATLSVFLIYWCGRRLFSRGIAFGGALILASSAGFFAMARASSTDMPLTAALTGALVFFVLGMDAEEAARRWYFYGFYAALGVGVLAKGPVAILLPALALVLFLLWRGGHGEWKRWYPKGILVTLLVALPWYVAVTWVNGREFIDVFIINQNLQRFTSDIHGHQEPFYFFMPVLLLMMFPWTFLLIPALRRRFSRSEQLILVWAVAPFVFFSLSGSKLPAYILPMAPPIALLCAREIGTEKTRAFQVAVLCQAAFSIAIGITVGFFGDAINVDVQTYGVLLAVASFLAAGALVGLAIWMPAPALGAFNTAVMAIVVLVITGVVFPHGPMAETMEPWTEELERFVSDQQPVILYKPDRWMEYGLRYYRDNNAVTALSGEALAELIQAGTRLICIAEGRMLDELSTSNDVAIEVVHSIGNQVAFWAWKP